jgi:hypothetical protein
MAQREKAADVVPLFNRAAAAVAEEVRVGRPLAPAPDAASAPVAQAVDLAGRPKLLMAIGAGNVGKTTLLRWVAERALRAERQVLFAAVDPENRELKDYFEGVHEPPSFDPAKTARWLEDFIAFALDKRASAAIDFGGGDTTLGRLVAESPDLAPIMEEAGVSPVAVYLLGPRLADLSPLATLENAGFRPRATALVRNEGRADPTAPREEEFARTVRHSAYRGRGAVCSGGRARSDA